MPFEVPADLAQAYSARSTLQIYKEAPLMMIFDNSWQNDIRMGENGSYIARIPDPDYTNVTVATRARNADYTAGVEVGQRFIDLTLNQHAGEDVKLYALDERETPLNYVDGIRRDLANKTANFIDSNILAYLAGLTVPGGRQLESKSTNANDVYDVSNGAYGSNVGKLLYDQVNSYGDALMSMGAIRGLGEMPTRPTWICPVAQYRALIDHMQAQRYSLDSLTEGVLRSSSIFDAAAYRGTLNGVNLVISDKFATPSASSEAYSYFVCSQSIAVAKIDDFISIISPMENQSRRAWDFHHQSDWGRVEVVAELTYRGGVQALA